MTRPLIAVALLSLVVGCGARSNAGARKKLKSRYDDISTRSKPLLANLEAVTKACVTLPTATSIDRISPDGAPLARTFSKRNLYYVHLSDLKAMVYRKAKPDLENTQPWINLTQELARAKAALDTPKGSISYFPLQDAWEAFRKVEYLLVLRGRHIAPRMHGDAKFVPGAYVGDAHLFSLKTGKHLGGFPLKVRSSGKVKVTYRRSKQYSDTKSDLSRNLSRRLRRALKLSLRLATGKKVL